MVPEGESAENQLRELGYTPKQQASIKSRVDETLVDVAPGAVWHTLYNAPNNGSYEGP
jgi:hypothetical protein